MDPTQFGASLVEEDKYDPSKFGATTMEEPKKEEGPFTKIYQAPYEAAASIASSMAAEPIAGYAGLAALATEGPEAGKQAVEKTREELTFKPRSEAGKELLQGIGETLSPVGEAMTAVENYLGDIGWDIAGKPGYLAGIATPTAVLELLGLAGIHKARGRNKITGIPDETVDDLAKKGVNVDDLSPEGVQRVKESVKQQAKSKLEEMQPPEEKTYDDILSKIKNEKTKKAAGEVKPDKEIMQAAEDLGIDLNPSHYSTNRAYMEVEQSLKSRPGSTLSSKELKAIDDLNARAGELITELGGTTDKSLLDLKVKSGLSDSISNLDNKAGKVYEKIGNHIPGNSIVDAPNSKTYIKQVLDDLGGDVERLTPAEKDLYKLSQKEKITYSALDRMRKDIGRGFKKQGIYKDEDTGLLKQAYRQISEDQQRIADGFGVGDDYSLARKLVSERKKLEDQSVSLFGREVNQSIIPKLKQAASSLTKGDISKFEKLMDSLPKSTREEAAVSMLDNIFTSDARSATGLSQGFVNAFENLNKNKTAKNVLFKYMPIEARDRFNKIGKVATGLYRAKALENTSKAARDLISAMDDGGMFKRVLDVSGKVAAAEGVTTTAGFPGAGAAGVIGSVLSKGKKSAREAADEFIASKKFTEAVKEAAEGNLKNADEMIKKSPKFKKWIKFAKPGDVEAIMTVGFIPWVTGQTEQEQNEQ